MSSSLADIAQKLNRGIRLDFADGLALYESDDWLRLGALAQDMTIARQGKNVYYSLNRHLNYTNICRMQCRFCGFSRRPGSEGGFTLTVDDVLAHALRAYRSGATEIHIVGGVHPDLPWDYYLDMVKAIRRDCPDMHIKAFTAVEIHDLASKSGLSLEATMKQLQEAGLDALPGGGAEILDDDYFQNVCPHKITPDRWLEVHACAHRLGLMSNATMLYGHGESAAQRIGHLLKLRQLQDRSLRDRPGHFQCFVPLPFIPPPDQNDAAAGIDAFADLKTMAVSRLMLDNFNHIKAFWPMLGIKLAQIALAFGANDLDGTVREYRIVDKINAVDNTRDDLSEDILRAVVLEANRTPVKRDGLYRPIK